ncbi:MAG: hypothetical protein IK139_02765 [Lachnospiraceae bacterium]|nr:hypothetical protein [Lachnospiraceae bacterium]
MISKNGLSADIVRGKKLDIYAAWFLPRIQPDGQGGYVEDKEGVGEMSGSPVKLYSVDYKSDGTVLIPNIIYYGKGRTASKIVLEYPGEDGPLFYDNKIQYLFWVKTVDSSQGDVPGDLTLRAISVNDPKAEDFLAQTTLSDGSLGRDVTEEGGWNAGDYYLLVYFKPDQGNDYTDVIKKFDLSIEPAAITTETTIDRSRSGDPDYLPIGYKIRYEDLSTKLIKWEWDYYDEEEDWDYYKRVEDTDHKLKNAKYLIRVVSGNLEYKDDEDYDFGIFEYPYDEWYVLSDNNAEVTLDKEGKFKVLVYNIMDGIITDNEGDECSNYTGTFGAYDYWYAEEYCTDPDKMRERERTGYSRYDTACEWPVTVLNPGAITITSRGNEMPYGVANQLKNDVTDKYRNSLSYRREQMDHLLYISSNGLDIYRGSGIDYRLKYFLDYIYSTSENGTYDTIDKLSAEDLELGKTIWVKAVVLNEAVSNAVSLKIGRQPVNIAAVCPTVTDPGQELNGTYKDDIYVYYMNPYPNENPRELRSKLSEWTGSDSAAIDLTGIDKNKEDTKTKTRLGISLNAAKSTHYELRSTAAIYVVRSSSAITPVAPVVDDDKKTEVKKEEIKHEMYTVQFIDAKTGEKLADSMGWDKEKGLPSNVSVTLKKSNFGVWSLGSDCSDKKIDITDMSIVKNSGTSYTFDLDTAMSLLKGDGVSVITFYGYVTEDVSKYIKVNEIAPVSYNGLEHVSTGDKSKGKSPDLFITVQLVTDDGILTLAEGKDYSLKYEDNKKAGDASVTVIGKGAYKGLSSKRAFRINPADITQAAVLVNPSYKYTNNGVSLTPKVTIDGKALKNGSGKDFTFELTEKDRSRVTGTYNKQSDPHEFRVKVTGNNNYSGTVYSEVFWGVPSNLKALNVTLGTSTIKYENRTYVTASDYQPKATNYDGTVSAQLYDLDYRPLEKGTDTGIYYYVGVRAAEPEAAIIKGISPAVTYKKVRFTGLKFNKTMFELSGSAFDFTNSNNAIQVKAKSGASVSWADVQVTFSDYYKPDGDYDLPFAKGTVEPKANDGRGANILDNLYPGSYTVYLTGTGRYYGTFKLSYKVNPMKAVIGQNMDIIVNGGNKVYYNAAGYDAQSAPVRVVIKGSGKNGDSVLKNASLAVSYSAKSSVANGGIVTLGNAYANDGTKIFKNSVKKKFGISACDLKAAMEIPGTGLGAVKKTTINLGARVPLLTLFQYGPLGAKVIAKNEFSTDDIKAKAAANPDKPFDLEVTPKDVNYTGGKFTVSGVDAYKSSYTKAKLKMSFSGGAEPEGGSYEKKNKNGDLYFKYTGKAVEPKVVVKDNQGNVISDEFYDVAYENNVMHSTAKSPAKAVVEFKRSAKTGQFPYGGKAEVKFYVVTDFASQK